MNGVGSDYNPWLVRGVNANQQRKRDPRQNQQQHGRGTNGGSGRGREQRKQLSPFEQARAQIEQALARPPKNTGPEISTAGRPDGDAGLVWDALRYLYECSNALKKFREGFKKLTDIVDEASRNELTDLQRRGCHRDYQMSKANFNREVHDLVSSTGEAFFLGEFAMKPKRLPLRSNSDEALELMLPALDVSSLELGRLRLLDLISAKRSKKKIEEVQTKLDKLEEYLHGRKSFLGFKATEYGMVLPDFDELKKEAEQEQEATRAAAPTYDRGEQLGSEGYSSPGFEHIRREQNRIARSKGRTKALLLSVKA